MMKSFIKSWLEIQLRKFRLTKEIKSLSIMRNIDINREINVIDNKLHNNKDKKLLIAFIIPGMPQGSGGHTSILRLGTGLAEYGHDVHYISYIPENLEVMVKNAEHNLKGFKGKICGPKALNSMQIDIGIATLWISAYYLWNLSNISYKAYFIQDYEPDFYPAGAVRVFAENTYRMGYHMISLGTWNKKRIEKEIGINVDSIVFPYEPTEYGIEHGWESKFQEKRIIKLCAYLKGAEKRGGVFLLMCLEELYKALLEREIKLEISLFGDDSRLKYPISVPYVNLGKLNKENLRTLYNKSDFGVVFSYTNISLVPLEMMACGCPVVEVADGSFKDFFDPDCAILVNSFPQDFVRKIIYYIDNPDERKHMAERALKGLQKKTWKEAVCQFHELLIKSYNNK